MKRIILTFTVCTCLAVFGFAVFNAVKIVADYEKADGLYEDLQNQYVETNTEQPKDTQTDETITGENEPNEVAPISIDFASLLEENSDIVGWIYCPDTPINYPVVQGKDNNQYLRRDLGGNYLVSGTIFVDYRNGAIGEDSNLLIYGHNMKDKSMFGTLVRYKEQAYYDEHPALYYLTPEADYKIELYAGIVVKRNAVIYQPNPDEAELAEFLNNAKDKSTFVSNVELAEDNVLITLSTCSYEYNNARYIVIGKLSRL